MKSLGLLLTNGDLNSPLTQESQGGLDDKACAEKECFAAGKVSVGS